MSHEISRKQKQGLVMALLFAIIMAIAIWFERKERSLW